jgi:hypothetical protein
LVNAGLPSFFFCAATAALALKQKLSFPVFSMWQGWVMRSSSLDQDLGRITGHPTPTIDTILALIQLRGRVAGLYG